MTTAWRRRAARHRAAGGLVTLALAAVAVPGTAAAPRSPACSYVALSPAFGRDRTGACTLIDRASGNVPTVHVTRDAGRSWRRASAVGLTQTESGSLRPIFSPRYGSDATLYVATQDGLYASTDLGETFAPVAALVPQANGQNPVVFVSTTAPPPTDAVAPGARVLIAGAYGEKSAVYDSRLRVARPILGTPGGTRYFAAPPVPTPDAPPLAFVMESRPKPDRPYGGGLVAYACDHELACAERRFAFPDDLYLQNVKVAQWGRATAYVALMLDLRTEKWTTWRSADGGRTFAPWRSLDAVLAATGRGVGSKPAFSVAADPTAAGTWWLRVSAFPPGPWKPGMPPAEQLFVSDRAGDRWRRVGYQLDISHRGRRGTLPWDSRGESDGDEPAQVTVAPDGRLFVIGTRQGTDRVPGLTAVWCSTDRGRTWRLSCAH